MKQTRIYYFNPFLTADKLRSLQQNKYPLHSYYGLNHFDNEIEVIVHKQRRQHPNNLINRILRNISNAIKIIFACRKYDLVYVTNSRGIKLTAFLRTLKILPKPVCMLIHWGITTPQNKFKQFVSKLYCNGFDYFFFFSRELLELSLKTGKVKNGKVIHWGVDLDFYDNIKPAENTVSFLSTGTEKRDFETLIKAFEKTNLPLTLYLTEKSGKIDYKSVLDKFSYNKSLINVIFLKEKINLTAISSSAESIVISLSPFAKNRIYPLGLTSLIEAMALSKPVIITDNRYNGIDVEKIGCGIKVEYGDIEGWVNAIKFIAENKKIACKMGEKGREYVEKYYNLNIFGKELSEAFKEISGKI